MNDLSIRPATRADLPRLHPVIERAYRGDSARQGWTHEADLLSGERIDAATLRALLDDPAHRLLLAEQDGVPVGCVSLTSRGDGLAYLGLLCVDPVLQGASIAKAILAEADHVSREMLGADRIEMTVIESRQELIAYYERRGFARTGERRILPVNVDPPLMTVVLERAIA